MSGGQMLYKVLPNRVRRNYRGGAMLSQWDGVGDATDGEQPEDWLASTVEAVNPGLPPVPQEGLAHVETPAGPQLLTSLIEADPQGMLGETHIDKFGHQLGFLAKFLDAGMRLHIQCHPTAAFAREHLDSRWGKMESYLILGVRPGGQRSLLLGFQHCPAPQEWRRIVMEQDMPAMRACFEPIPVHPGELWYVPGGVPHAIGEGLLVLEVMEPTDLVVRCEFEREGLVVPPPGRFMDRDPDFALSVFKHEEMSVEDVRQRYRLEPRTIAETPQACHEELFGRGQSECFCVERIRLTGDGAYTFDPGGRLALCIVTEGSGSARAGAETHRLAKADRCFASAAAGALHLQGGGDGMELVICLPQLDRQASRAKNIKKEAVNV